MTISFISECLIRMIMKIPVLYVHDRGSDYLDLANQWKIDGIEIETSDSADEAIKIIKNQHLVAIITEAVVPPGTLQDPGLSYLWNRYRRQRVEPQLDIEHQSRNETKWTPYIDTAKYLIGVARQSRNAKARIMIASRFEPNGSANLRHAQQTFRDAGADAYFYLDEMQGCDDLTREVMRIARNAR